MFCRFLFKPLPGSFQLLVADGLAPEYVGCLLAFHQPAILFSYHRYYLSLWDVFLDLPSLGFLFVLCHTKYRWLACPACK
jgi:hypothetical protein